MLCFTLCRRGRAQQLRQQADDQSAVPTVAVHVKVEGSTVTIGNPEPAETPSNPVDSAQPSVNASAAASSAAPARADDHDARVRTAPEPAARAAAKHAAWMPKAERTDGYVRDQQLVWVTKTRGKSYHSRRSCGTLDNAKALEQIARAEAIRKGFKPCKCCYGG